MNDTEKYFDLHINGIGYLSRAREVKPKRGAPFLVVDITALYGPSGDTQKTRFDCRVVGGEAKKVIERFMSQINDKGHMASDGTTLRHKVLVGFRIGDLYVDMFTYEKGEKKGQTGVSLKARLLRLDWMRLDGEMVYRAATDAAPEEASDTTVATGSEQGRIDETDVDEYLPGEVQLSTDDPDFAAKKERLKKQGYRFDGQAKVWRLPAAA